MGFTPDMAKRDLVSEVKASLVNGEPDWYWKRGYGMLGLITKYIFIAFTG